MSEHSIRLPQLQVEGRKCEAQGVCQGQVDGRIKFYTCVVRE